MKKAFPTLRCVSNPCFVESFSTILFSVSGAPAQAARSDEKKLENKRRLIEPAFVVSSSMPNLFICYEKKYFLNL